MKKIIAILLVVFLTVGMACANPTAETQEKKKTAVLRWHSANNDQNPRTLVGVFMQNRIKELTDDLVIEVYSNAQLGSSDEVHQMIAMGENIASATDSAWFAKMLPGENFDIINGPFLLIQRRNSTK